MNTQKQFQLRHLVLLAGAALWGTATPVAAQDAPTISVSDATVVKPTGAGQSAEFIVSRSGDTAYPIIVGYQTQDGTAKAGTDYTASSGVVIIPAGATEAVVKIPVSSGSSNASESFLLKLTDASGPFAPELEQPPQEIQVGTSPGAVASADFNRDGRLDLAVLDDQVNVSILLNVTADGAVAPSFGQRTSFLTGEIPADVAAVDLNGDGKPDLVVTERAIDVTDRSNDAVRILLNVTPDGALTPQFLPGETFDAGVTPNVIAFADFNGDGKQDLVIGNGPTIFDGPCPGCEPTGQSVAILLNTTTPGALVPSFALRENFDPGVNISVNISSIITADLDQDGRPDVAVSGLTNRARSGFLLVLLNATDDGAAVPKFSNGPALDLLGGTAIAAIDFNKDGRLDIAFSPNGISVFLARDSSTLEFAEPVHLGNSEEIVALDFDGNGAPELTRLRDASPIFTGFSRVTADFNGDGRPERAGTDSAKDSLLVFLLPFLPAEIFKAQGTGTILPAADTTPARFSFIDRFFVARGQPQVSNAIFVRGINQPAPIAVNGGSYSINNGPYVTSPGLAKNGDRVRVALFAPNQFNTAAHVQLTVGGVSDVFTTRTRGPVLDNFLSRLFGFDFLNQGGFAIAGLTGSAIR